MDTEQQVYAALGAMRRRLDALTLIVAVLVVGLVVLLIRGP